VQNAATNDAYQLEHGGSPEVFENHPVVDPEHGGQGIANAMIDWFEEKSGTTVQPSAPSRLVEFWQKRNATKAAELESGVPPGAAEAPAEGSAQGVPPPLNPETARPGVDSLWVARDADGNVIVRSPLRPEAAAAARREPGGTLALEARDLDPRFGDDASARFSEPNSAEAKAQAEGLTHDVQAAVDAGRFADLHFSLGEGINETAASLLGKLDDDDAALAAIRGCL
jgi:hypothetical protein